MSSRDDHIDALLRSFRANEGRMDDAIRSRIWAQITEADPEASIWLDTLDRGARIRQIRRRAPRPSRIIAAAAVLLLLAVAQMVVRSGPGEEPFVSAGPSTTVPIPRDLDEFANRVATVHGTVLGETEDTRYTYLRGVRTVQHDPTRVADTFFEQRWIADNGSGREVIDLEGSGRAPDVYTRGPGVLEIGFLPPGTALELPDDTDTVLATFIRGTVVEPGSSLNPMALVDLLTYAGVPGPARAGTLRALDRLGFEPAPGPDPAPNLWRVEGSGPDGSTVQVDFDLRTGEVAAWTRLLPGGGFTRVTNIEIDLRRDTQGS